MKDIKQPMRVLSQGTQPVEGNKNKIYILYNKVILKLREKGYLGNECIQEKYANDTRDSRTRMDYSFQGETTVKLKSTIDGLKTFLTSQYTLQRDPSTTRSNWICPRLSIAPYRVSDEKKKKWLIQDQVTDMHYLVLDITILWPSHHKLRSTCWLLCTLLTLLAL